MKPDTFKPKAIANPRKHPTMCRSGKNSSLPAYVYVRRGTVKRTVDLIAGRVMADYDKAGNLLGVEVIG